MPLASDLSHLLLQELSKIRKEGREMTYLRPDSKSQVTIEYNNNQKPERVHTIVVSTQHDPFDKDDSKMLKKIREDVLGILIPRVKMRLSPKARKIFNDDFVLHVKSYREVCNRRPSWRYRPYRKEDHC